MRRVASLPVNTLLGKPVKIRRPHETIMMQSMTHRAEPPLIDQYKQHVVLLFSCPKPERIIYKPDTGRKPSVSRKKGPGQR